MNSTIARNAAAEPSARTCRAAEIRVREDAACARDLAFDQRGEGFACVSGAAAGIGAFELQIGPPDAIF
jgi:hypothetical protein